MKAFPSAPRNAGFSMVELMTVIGIMVLLAGILIAALPGVQNRVNRNKTETLMAELESGLSAYQLDHGIYPQNPPSGGDRDNAGVEGASVLYKHLSGDWNEDGAVDLEENEEVYVQKLSYDQNQGNNEPRADAIGGEYMVIDPFGNPWRYLSEPPNLPEEERQTYNPTYDLWSIVDTDPDDEEAQARHITNWQSN